MTRCQEKNRPGGALAPDPRDRCAAASGRGVGADLVGHGPRGAIDQSRAIVNNDTIITDRTHGRQPVPDRRADPPDHAERNLQWVLTDEDNATEGLKAAPSTPC